MIFQMGTMISLTTVCFSSIDQYLSTNHRYDLRQKSTLKLAQRLTLINVCIWTLHSIPFGIFHEIQLPIGCTIINSNFRLYFSFVYLFILNGILPLIISALFSALSYQNVRRIIRRQIPIVRRKLDQQLTAMVLSRVLFLLVASIPYGLLLLYNMNTSDRIDTSIDIAIKQLIFDVTSTLFFFNYAVGIFFI